MLLSGERHWQCPNCQLTDVSTGPGQRYHQCPGLRGLLAPMVPAGFKGQVKALEREDYIRKEDVILDGNGRPIMAVVTEREDGSNDCAVFAPTAYGIGQ